MAYVNNILDICPFTQRKTCSINHLHCSQQVNISLHPSYHSNLASQLLLLLLCLLFLGSCHSHCYQGNSYFPKLAGSAFICWIYYCDLNLFIGLAPGDKVGLDVEVMYTVLQSRELSIKQQPLTGSSGPLLQSQTIQRV